MRLGSIRGRSFRLGSLLVGAALVATEIARLEDRELDAERLYEEAIRLAREHGFIHYEGLGNELAAWLYGEHGFETIADAYLRNARSCSGSGISSGPVGGATATTDGAPPSATNVCVTSK